MLEIVILIDGQVADPARMTNLMHAMVVKSMIDHLQHKLGRVICPEHEAQPRVTVNIASGKQHISVEGCCQPLIDRTAQALQAS